MPTLGAPLDFAKLEGRNFVGHLLGTAPSSPVKGQLYMNTADNTLYWYDGTQWVAAKAGAGTPTGPAGGDLSGTYPNPQIAPGVITDVDVAAPNKDGVAGTLSLRTLGAGAQQAMPGNRTLDAITAPAADVNMNGKKIIQLLDPVLSSDAASKSYVDSVASGLDAKASVKAASTANINIATATLATTIDGVTPVQGDRILLKDQTTPSQNGIYVAVAGPGWSRALDMDNWAEVPGAFVWVEQGIVNADTGWVSTADQGGTIGSTSMPWTQFSGAAQITAGAGLTKTGNTLDAGAGAGITVNPDSIQVSNNGITNAMIADGAIDLSAADVTSILPISKGGTGADATLTTGKVTARNNLAAAGVYVQNTHGAGTTITIPQTTHGLKATSALIVQAQIIATGAVVWPDVAVAANGDVTVTFAVSQSASTIQITVIG